MIKISIIIVNYNTKDLLINCIESIYANCKDLYYEIIVVDNGSKDGSLDALKQKNTRNNIYVKAMRQNFGFAKAVNIGVEIAQGKYLLLLNTDTIVKPESIQKLYDFMEQNQETAVCGPQLLNEDESLQNSIDNFPNMISLILNKGILRIINPKKYAGKKAGYTESTEVDSIIGACFFVRRDIFNKLNRFDEDYFFFFEETDFCLRAKKSGFKIFFIPDSYIIHFQGRSSENKLFEIRKKYFCARYIFLKKHGYKEWQIFLLKQFFTFRLLINAGFTFILGLISFNKKKIFKSGIYFRLFLWNMRFAIIHQNIKS